MKYPPAYSPLVADGIIDEVLYPLKSGKEAQVFVVRAEGEIVCAKVYKEAAQRSSNKPPSIKRPHLGRPPQPCHGKKYPLWPGGGGESLVERGGGSLKRLAAAGVRVPKPYSYVDGVLLMELIQDESGDPAPRLTMWPSPKT